MKHTVLLLFVFFTTLLCAEEALKTPQEDPTLQESFSYGRLGVFTFGGEAALGHRFRSERFGWGPNINIAASYTAFPSALLNFEVLYYPKSWENGYWGLMPGIGIGNIAWVKSTHTIFFDIEGNIRDKSSTREFGRKWHIWGGLELIFGKEFYKNGKRRFHQLSIGFPYVGYNYGWAF